MKTVSAATALVLAIAAAAAAPPARAAAGVGQLAPDFSAVDTTGRPVSLAAYRGRTVVLEWVNPGCPFVQKHYHSGNMQGTQRQAAARGVVWLAVASTAPEAADYRAPAALAQWMREQNAAATATLMDSDGRIGRAYGARTTPHLYIIDPAGTLIYAGGIDSKASANPADIAGATNYVRLALSESLAGKPLSHPTTPAFGCSFKYAAGA